MTKSCWQVTASGRTFCMVGEPCTYADALEFVRLIWPDAEVT